MNVEVKDRLAGARSNIEHCPVSVFNAALARNLGRREMTTADDFRVFTMGFFQSTHMPLGNNQHMGRGLGIDVLKRVSVFIFINFLGGNFTRNDPAEQTVSHDTP